MPDEGCQLAYAASCSPANFMRHFASHPCMARMHVQEVDSKAVRKAIQVHCLLNKVPCLNSLLAGQQIQMPPRQQAAKQCCSSSTGTVKLNYRDQVW
jgi:hypothetical protein